MEEYVLTEEGKWRFGWIRDNMPTENEAYRILGYLYENGTGTVDAITAHTRLPRDEVAYTLESFKYEHLVEERT